MARITVEDCLEKVPNRFSLVLVAAERAKQLMKGSPSLIEDDRTNKNKEIVTALREIAAGQVVADLSEFDENELLRRADTPADGADGGALPPDFDDSFSSDSDE